MIRRKSLNLFKLTSAARLLTVAALATAAMQIVAAPRAEALPSAFSHVRWGLMTGYGGIGINAKFKDPEVDNKFNTAEKAEGPFLAGVFVEKLLSDTFLLGLEHVRGVSIVPFSSGASQTGLALRWYFFGPAPSMEVPPEGESSLLIKRFVPFLGISGGVLLADIYRDDAKFPHVSGSGTYFGVRIGADYMLAPGYGIRPEFSMAATSYTASFSTAENPPELTQFSVGCGWFWNF